ncbi:hypothetical protein IAD21_00669 [Abditibacteriota bacterium]|nr:hypothetical protein IAD21_00669 [Abditibacteriota bacterium]
MFNPKAIAAFAVTLSLGVRFAAAQPPQVASTPPPVKTTFTYAPRSTGGGVHVSPTSYMTVTGYVTNKPVNGVFHLRNRRGRVFQVDFGQPQVPTEGTLTIYGHWDGTTLKTTNFYYDDGLYGSRAYSESKRQIPTHKGQLTGTVVDNAEPGGFDLRDLRGNIHSILISKIPGAKTLRKGIEVRVAGDMSIRDNVSELDMSRMDILTHPSPPPRTGK